MLDWRHFCSRSQQAVLGQRLVLQLVSMCGSVSRLALLLVLWGLCTAVNGKRDISHYVFNLSTSPEPYRSTYRC
jgi:hypothetical protein